MPKIDKSSFLLLWLFNPLISSIYLFKNFKYNTNIYPYLLLSFFFGLSFVVSTSGGDSQRYAMELIQLNQQNLSFGEMLNNLYTEEGTKIDIYQTLVTWLVSKFTINAKILFSIYAVVFGYFWFKGLIIIRSKISIPLKNFVLLVFILLVFTNPIWNISGVRMWTAIGVFFYGVIQIHILKTKKGWFFLIIPMLIHFSLILPLAIYVFYRIIPVKNVTLLFGIYLGTFFLGELDLNVIKNYLLILPDFIQSKDGYLNEEYATTVKEFSEQKSSFYILSTALSKYTIFFMTCVIFFYGIFKNKFKDNFLSDFFFMALLFLSFTNIISLMPSGGRFGVLSNLILLTSFLFFLNKKILLHPIIKLVIGLSSLIVLIFKLRVGVESIGIFLFLGNPIVNWLIVDSPIIVFLKGIL